MLLIDYSMNKIIKTMVSALFIVPVLVSCKGNGNILSIGKPEFVSEFPRTGQLKEIESFNLNEIGLRSVKVVDTLLFVDKAGVFGNIGNAWVIYSLDGKKEYGGCMRTGNGPGEFPYSAPYVSSCYFFNDNDSLFVHAPNRNKGQILELNITRHLQDSSQAPHPVIETGYMQSNSWAVNPCGKGKVLITQPNDYLTGFQRLMYENDTVRQLAVTHDIDKATISPGGDVNLIAKVVRYDAAADMFVEAMLYLNQINIYSADGTEGKTICVGKKLDDVSVVEKTPEAERGRDYISVSAWEEGFGAIYFGGTILEYQQRLVNDTQIQFFDWEGNPKYLVELPYQASAFDIDFKNNVMYVINKAEDTLTAYDATEIVQSMRN